MALSRDLEMEIPKPFGSRENVSEDPQWETIDRQLKGIADPIMIGLLKVFP